MAKDVKRAPRVAERLREEIAQMVMSELGDPRLAGVIISRVELTDDLVFARVQFRLLQGGEHQDARDQAKKGLERSAGFLRREVTTRLSLRHAPELRFHYDEGQDASSRVEELLHEINSDSGKSDSGRSDSGKSPAPVGKAKKA